jgi:hypothetical protein
MIFQNVTVGIALKEILALDIWQNVHHGSLGECSTIFAVKKISMLSMKISKTISNIIIFMYCNLVTDDIYY